MIGFVVSTLQPSLALQQAAAEVALQGGFGVVQQAFFVPELQLAASQIDVTPGGTPLRLDWPQISGATEVALDSARITLLPPAGAQAGISLGDLHGAHDGIVCVIPIPDAPRPIRSLKLRRLRESGEDMPTLRKTAVLRDQTPPLRLAVAIKAGGVLAPVSLAVPHIDPSPANPPYLIPPLLAGASYDGFTLTLPDVMAEEIQIMLVTGDDPEDFTPVPFVLDSVGARAAPSPVDVAIMDADGAPFYTGTGPITAAVTIDAKNAVQRALESAIASGADPVVDLNVTGRTVGQLGTYGIVASGEVRRVFDDKIAVTLEGAPVTPALPGAPLDAQVPASASADLVVDHAGVRLHAMSDPLPGPVGGLSGPVLGMEAPIWRALPPEGLRGEVLRRVGIVGYGLEAAELSLRVLEASPDGSAIAPPDLATGTCAIAAPDLTQPQVPRVCWFDLGEGVTVDRSIGIEVTAQSGRFLWIAEAGVPKLRLAVTHDLTGGEVVLIGSHAVALTGPRTTLNGTALTPAVFAAPPAVSSDHFLTLTLSRLTLGYTP